MKNTPLVSISIPTFNSENFLAICLRSIQDQDYRNIEVNIVDGASKDATVEIAKHYKVKDIIICKDALLRARFEGLRAANGEFVLLLDSDQVLERDSIRRAVEMAQNGHYDMLVLEENVYRVENWLERLFQLDRKLIHSVKDFDPYTGVMLPRFYNRSLLRKAFSSIPKETLDNVGGQDHAIIYFEAWQLSQAVAMLPHAVKHIEPNSLMTMVKKFYRWGYTSNAAHHPRYDELLSRKERFRKGLFNKGLIKASLASILLLLIKGVPYFAGLWAKRIKLRLSSHGSGQVA